MGAHTSKPLSEGEADGHYRQRSRAQPNRAQARPQLYTLKIVQVHGKDVCTPQATVGVEPRFSPSFSLEELNTSAKPKHNRANDGATGTKSPTTQVQFAANTIALTRKMEYPEMVGWQASLCRVTCRLNLVPRGIRERVGKCFRVVPLCGPKGNAYFSDCFEWPLLSLQVIKLSSANMGRRRSMRIFEAFNSSLRSSTTARSRN